MCVNCICSWKMHNFFHVTWYPKHFIYCCLTYPGWRSWLHLKFVLLFQTC
jgi:hypothetical protein